MNPNMTPSPGRGEAEKKIERLIDAARRSDLAAVERMLDETPELIAGPAADPALRAAGRHGSLEILRLLLDRGARPPADILFDTWGEEKFRFMIERGADVSVKTSHHGASDWTILHSAARRQPAGVVGLLLELGCDLNARAGDGDYRCKGLTPMQAAAKCAFQDRREKVDLFRAAGAEADVFTAAYLGDAAAIATALNDDPSALFSRDAYDATPLHAAIASGSAEAVRSLIEKGADVNARNEEGQTPSLLAALSGREELIRLLLDSRPALDVFSLSALGRTIELLVMLQSAPDQARAKDEGERTPLHWACRAGQIQTIRVLLEHGADPEARDRLGRTPLWSACLDGRREAAELLLSYGADVNARENSGRTLRAYDLGGLDLSAYGLTD
jgi:ankyrin repeat protein